MKGNVLHNRNSGVMTLCWYIIHAHHACPSEMHSNLSIIVVKNWPSVCLYNHINEHFMNYWKTSVADVALNPILRTYNWYKPYFKFETYLEVVKDGRYRHSLTKFRTSSHTLEIERGRHTNTEVNNRLCTYCERIDDERYFIQYCDVIDYERQCLFEKVNYH